ncbi:MAG: radical SAM protein, partial [Sedimentisphaerales bacterium]|nr:radical SAM protein [Sedimentisphaerales bacterium]
IALYSLESKAAVKSFDIVGFSLTNELCYTNVLAMLDLAGLELRSSQRGEDDPLIIAGGGMANCGEPMADFIDLFVLGEAEEAVVQLVELMRECKRSGISKSAFLLEAAKRFDWAYVPSLYRFGYEGEKIKSFAAVEGTGLKPAPTEDKEGDRKGRPYQPCHPLRTHFDSAVVNDFDNASAPRRPIVPFVQAVHERVSVEIMRGCPGRCRFCQASFCRRPVRYRSVERIVEIAKEQYQATGFDTVSLLSLSTADYPQLEELVGKLNEYFSPLHVGVSLPSLRVDQQLKIMPQLAGSVRKGGLTIAVEAASERLRNVINKPLTNENLFAGVEAAYRAGWRSVKLYFMVGFPGETQDDIKAIFDLCYELASLRKKIDGKIGAVTAAVSWLVPKAHTPFGYLAQKPKEYFEEARQLLLAEKRRVRSKFVDFKFHDTQRSTLESAIGRGDRRLCDVIETAFRSGARFDLWDECFSYQLWKDAFAKHGFDAEHLAQKGFAQDDIVPWQHLGGPGADGLWRHYTDAMEIAQ